MHTSLLIASKEAGKYKNQVSIANIIILREEERERREEEKKEGRKE